MQEPKHSEVVENMTKYLAQEFSNAEDEVIQQFIELVGSDKPAYWDKQGYDMLDIENETRTNELERKTRVLRRGKNRIIAAMEITLVADSKTRVVTKSLSKQEIQELLAKSASSNK